MTEEQEKLRLEENLEEARRGLHETAEQVRQKVEKVELYPERVIASYYPAATIGVTAAIGFLAGSTLDQIFEPILFGLLLGYGTAKLLARNSKSSE
jgi:ElaB/YqjD/DUF883 family membrane-anchored ribosome-binding protein